MLLVNTNFVKLHYISVLKVKASDHTKKYSYMSLAKELYGPKVEFFVKLVFFINNWGGVVVYTTLVMINLAFMK